MEQTNLNWLEEESKQLNSGFEGEKLPALKLEPNKVVEIEVDFTKPFQKWNDTIHKSVKAIIPVSSNSTKLNFWLNVKNPLYGQIVQAGKEGKSKLKIIQTGSKQDTRYSLVN